MEGTRAGKLQLLAIIAAFIGWCLVSIRQEHLLMERVREAEQTLAQEQLRHEASEASLEQAIRNRGQVYEDMEHRKNGLEVILEDAGDWDAIDVPDSVWRSIQTDDPLPASGHAPGRREDTLTDEREDSGRYGAAADR